MTHAHHARTHARIRIHTHTHTHTHMHACIGGKPHLDDLVFNEEPRRLPTTTQSLSKHLTLKIGGSAKACA